MGKKLKLTAISKSLLLTFLIMVCSSILVLAQNSFTVTPKVENGGVTIVITETTNLNDEVSILIVDKNSNDIKYVNQAKLEEGKVEFKTILSKGTYVIKVNTTTNTLGEISKEIEVTESSKPDEDNNGDTENEDNENNTPGNGNGNGNNTPGSGNESNESDNDDSLVNTGSRFDTQVLMGIGLLVLIIGASSVIYIKKKGTK